MLRNKQFRNYLIILVFISFLTTPLFFLQSITAGVVALISFSLCIFFSYIFTLRRYRDIEKLSEYLRRLCAGDYSLDIRDNQEGELSILKNEIYKVTIILSKQSNYLREEKAQLADALSDISHQLKTPLTSMRIMTDLLSTDNLTLEKRTEFINNIQIQLDRMEWLLTSLLKLSKIDAGSISFKKDEVKVMELIKKAIKPILIPLEIKAQTLEIKGAENTVLICDINWTAEALINILKNCVEHTDKSGKIVISFSKNPLYTEINISDNGSGIDKDDIPYIFKRFYKGKNASEESVGIGLAMAKSIITNQKGDINVESEKDLGTKFTIKFFKQII